MIQAMSKGLWILKDLDVKEDDRTPLEVKSPVIDPRWRIAELIIILGSLLAFVHMLLKVPNQ